MVMQSSRVMLYAGIVLLLLAGSIGCDRTPYHDVQASAQSTAPFETVLALAPPKDGRIRPLVVVLADNAGTETTDFVIPFGILKESGVADVVTVSTGPGAVTLMPALRTRTDMTVAQFDAAVPEGADILIVPAMKQNDTPALLDWVIAQSKKGAAVVSICEGTKIIANAGLLAGKSATTHWSALDSLARKFPGTTWVRDRRWVVDENIMTTTGVTASIPASLALVESIAGRHSAQITAQVSGVDIWSIEHDTADYAFTARNVAVGVANWLARWRHETIAIPVEEGFDEVSTALMADAWSRTFRSQAVLINASGAVHSRHGLLIETDAALTPESHVLHSLTGGTMMAVESTLDDIAVRYGEPTANMVALGLEYRRH